MGTQLTPVKVAIPLWGTACADGSHPILTAYAGRARLGPVAPGTCAWIDGLTAQSKIQLACGALLSPPAAYAPRPGGAALCAVPAAQDFR